MSERGMGNVDNRANVGTQTIINIQNMTGNIGIPNKKVEAVKAVTLDVFDQHVNVLDGIMTEIVDTLGKDAMRQTSKDEWQEFYLALQNTVRYGRAQSDATGELKTFINNITSLYKDWEEIMIRRSENLPVDNAADVFGKIVKETDTYLFFRNNLEAPAEPKTAKPKLNFEPYLKKAKEKYSTIKTLLYSDQPKPFYDFYVCNDIERRIPACLLLK